MKAPLVIALALFCFGSRNMAQTSGPGTLDPFFAVGRGFDSYVNALALQSDGKIVVGGGFSKYNDFPTPKIARLLPNGDLDPVFQPGTGPNAAIEYLFLGDDGKILIGGNFTTVNGSSQYRVARLNSDGSLDTSYNPELPLFSLMGMDLQADQKLLLAGTFSTVNGQPFKYLARLNEDGTLDESFTAYRYISPWPSALKLQQDGKILISGAGYSQDGLIRDQLFRLNPDGSLDESFDSHGVTFASGDLAILSDGSILADWLGMIRLFSDGTLDPAFRMDDPFPHSIFPLPDGRILGHFSSRRPAVFFSDGTVHFEATHFNSGINAVVPGPNSTLYVGGAFTRIGDLPVQGIARIFLDTRADQATLEWNGANFTALEVDGKALLPIFRLGQTNSSLSIRVSTAPLTAEDNVDFAPANLTMSFEPGETLKYVDISLLDDTTPEPDETFQVTLEDLGGSFSDSAVVHIISDEGFVEITFPSAVAHELSKSIHFEIRKIGAVPYAITNQLASFTSTATVGQDLFWSPASQLKLQHGVGTKPVIIAIDDDQIVEADEFMAIELGQPLGNHAISTARDFRLTILDNDRPGAPGEGLNAPGTIVPLPEGGFLLVGSFTSIHGVYSRGAARLNTAGQFTSGFMPHVPAGGFFSRPFRILPLAGLQGGKSFFQIIYSNSPSSFFDYKIGFMRLNADGTLDTAYKTNLTFASGSEFHVGQDGRILVADGPSPGYNLRLVGTEGQLEAQVDLLLYQRAHSGRSPIRVGRQSTGHFLVAGDVYGLTNPIAPHFSKAYALNLLRFNPDGTPDVQFNQTVDAPLGWTIQSLAILPNDHILLAGNFSKVGLTGPPLARLLPDGDVDPSFTPDFSFMGTNAFTIFQMLPKADGKALLHLKSEKAEHLVQLTETGAVDNSYPHRVFERNLLHSMVELADGRVALSGNFTEIDGKPRYRLAYFSTSGELLHDQPVELLAFAPDGNSLHFDLASRFEGAVDIEASVDLINWTTIHTAHVTPGQRTITLPLPTPGAKFYRGVHR